MKRIFRRLLFWLGLAGLAAGAAILAVLCFFLFRSPDFSKVNDKREMSIIFDETGQVIREYCTFCREITTLDSMGNFPALAVAAEDKNFWNRKLPIDKWAFFRALWQDLKSRRVRQGGSTITQQTARILLAEEELKRERESNVLYRKFWRKAREIYLAARFESAFDKRKILELYLNNVWCGGRYGVKACSRYYFGKTPAELSIEETAMIVGLWRSPNSTPFVNYEQALALRGRVLDQLVKEKAISAEKSEELKGMELPSSPPENGCSSDHAMEFVRRKISSEGRLVDAGLRVYTTINCEWQKAASDALRESIEKMKERNPELTDLRGVAILVSTRNGAIHVFAQEPGFKQNQYLIDQIKRHAGSVFKPFFYTAWLEAGGRLSCDDDPSSKSSGPCRLDDSFGTSDGKSGLSIYLGKDRGVKRLQNFPYLGMPRYHGLIPPIKALAESRNVATMSGISGVRGSRIEQLVRKEDVLIEASKLGIRIPTLDPDTARRRGIALISPAAAFTLGLPTNAIDPELTVAIGSIDVSPFDIVRAFTGFLDGIAEPYMVQEIRNGQDEIAHSAPFRDPKPVLDDKVRLAMIRGLRATVEFDHGTCKLARIGDSERGIPRLEFNVMCKTGTATGSAGETTDNWVVGCTPSYCMVVWIGREKKLPIPSEIKKPDGSIVKTQETGGRNALPVFVKTIHKVYESQAQEFFPESTNPMKPFRPGEIQFQGEERKDDYPIQDDF